jgi:hypothetical protein
VESYQAVEARRAPHRNVPTREGLRAAGCWQRQEEAARIFCLYMTKR